MLPRNERLDRRQFIASATLLGGGMALGVGRALSATPDVTPWASDRSLGSAFTSWIEIAADDTITVHVPEPEIGNGAMTQAAMTVAEELECDWSKVRTVFASVQRNYLEDGVYAIGFQPFFGGHSTQQPRFAHMLQLGASARERLKAAAAARWGVPASEIVARNSMLAHASTDRSFRFGEVAADAAKISLTEEPKPKPASDWRLIGKKSLPKINAPDIAAGRAVYGIDVQLPGMVHAALRQCPVQGGKLLRYDPRKIMQMPGVRAVVAVEPGKTRGSPVPQKSTFGLGDSLAQAAVAVIADHFWQAKTALEALDIEWDLGTGVGWQDGAKIYAAAGELRGGAAAKPLREAGDLANSRGKRTVEAEYATPYGENAAMEPLNATALVTADSAEVWAPTQDQQQAYWVAIDETGLTPEKVKFHATLVGGGFGRRTQGDDVRMAVAIARQFPGRPVKVVWTREETFRQGRYRTPITTRFSAVLDDATGLPNSISGDMAYVGTRPAFLLPLGFSDQPYFHGGAIPNLKLTAANLPIHLLNGAYRAPCYNSHVFMVESFIDECAVAAGIDPLAYRLSLLAPWDPEWSKCLKVAAEKAGWDRPRPKGEGIGIAISCWPMASLRKNGSVVATAARVVITPDGELRVKQIDVAFDCGSVANPDAVRAQVEGATLFGLNAALNEELTVKDGAIVEGNFDEYPMLRLADTPPVHVHFDALSGHQRMAIIGEAPVGPIQAAVANAISAAIGVRLRRTPFRTADLTWKA